MNWRSSSSVAYRTNGRTASDFCLRLLLKELAGAALPYGERVEDYLREIACEVSLLAMQARDAETGKEETDGESGDGNQTSEESGSDAANHHVILLIRALDALRREERDRLTERLSFDV